MKKNLLNNKIVERYKIWFLIPIIIFCIALIVFLGFSINTTINEYNQAIANGVNPGQAAGDAIQAGANEGFNIGIDFEGGTLLTVTLGEDKADKNFNTTAAEISNIITSKGVKVTYKQKTGSGEDAGIIFKFDAIKDEAVISEIADAIVEKYPNEITNRNKQISFNTITATASSDLVLTAVLSIVISTVLILIYVIFRFEFWSAISAVLALIHDVLMMLCLTVIFRIQINSSFIAAIITIVAYSINATIVLFDRVRENQKLYEKNANKNDRRPFTKYICNKSIKETFTRNINTTVTTLVAITVLAIIGDVSIREFAMPVIFGLVVGCYSSMVISPSIYTLLKNRFSKDTRKFYTKDKKDKQGKKPQEVAEVA